MAYREDAPLESRVRQLEEQLDAAEKELARLRSPPKHSSLGFESDERRVQGPVAPNTAARIGREMKSLGGGGQLVEAAGVVTFHFQSATFVIEPEDDGLVVRMRRFRTRLFAAWMLGALVGGFALPLLSSPASPLAKLVISGLALLLVLAGIITGRASDARMRARFRAHLEAALRATAPVRAPELTEERAEFASGEEAIEVEAPARKIFERS